MNAHRTLRAVRARRTARSAGLLAVAVAGALSLTACQDSGSTSASATTNSSTATSSSPASSAPAASSSAPSSSSAGSAPAGGGQASQNTASETSAQFRTQTLADGSKAQIYQLGAQHYRAKIVNSGQVLATIETGQHDAGLDANDMFIVLGLDGTVHSWMGGDHQGPGTFKLAGGWTAKVTKIGELRYRAQIIGNDGVDATMETDQQDAGLDANGVYIVLSDGGIISAHA
jgi:hypothetical protein